MTREEEEQIVRNRVEKRKEKERQEKLVSEQVRMKSKL